MEVEDTAALSGKLFHVVIIREHWYQPLHADVKSRSLPSEHYNIILNGVGWLNAYFNDCLVTILFPSCFPKNLSYLKSVCSALHFERYWRLFYEKIVWGIFIRQSYHCAKINIIYFFDQAITSKFARSSCSAIFAHDYRQLNRAFTIAV